MKGGHGPCPICGETERVTVSERGCEELLWGIDPDGRVVRDPTGKPTEEGPAHCDDLICCDVCGTWVPGRIWKATPDFIARMRANIIAADAEYDADGNWTGPSTSNVITLKGR